ncbi:hypothetical protein [Actinomadura rugatobispora]|uniref:DUF3040 domain-containing protein n=1 Tax=Actinomadura rugatobispora TaxID=1994 RepID=A0ABW1A0H4_9ACTN|nr:hypothetical protein GCM10010200_029210 [Actinomadura rugatobispora]
MNDDLETLVREHYRRAADGIHPDPALLHRLQNPGDAGESAARRAPGPGRRRLFRWAVPVLAAVAVALVFLWPADERPSAPRPISPPSEAPVMPVPSPSVPAPMGTAPSPRWPAPSRPPRATQPVPAVPGIGPSPSRSGVPTASPTAQGRP